MKESGEWFENINFYIIITIITHQPFFHPNTGYTTSILDKIAWGQA